MLGLGKIIGGLFESVGLGWMGQVFSLATNFMTGNWAGVAQDIFRLVSEFSNDSWQSRVDRFQPLGSFGRGGCFGDNSLSESRINDLRERADEDDFSPNVRGAFNEAGAAVDLQFQVNYSRSNAYSTVKV